MRKDNVKTSIVTVHRDGTSTGKKMGEPVDGLGYGAKITGAEGTVAVEVTVAVGV